LTVPEGEGTPSTPEGGNEPPALPTPPPVVEPKKPDEGPRFTHTQDDVNSIVSRRVNEVAEKTKQDIAKSLGVSLEEAAEVIKQANQAKEAEKTELEKERDARAKEQSEAQEQITQAQQADHDKAVKLQLLLVGVPLPEDKVQRAAALDRLAGFVKVPVGASVEDIDGDIEALKTEFPQIFKAPEPAKPSPNPSSNPSGAPRKPSLGTRSPSDIAKEIAAQSNAKRGVTKPA
jgi:DNA-binding transcriptional MerR regulator